MISQLPPRIGSGVLLLAFVAGAVNVIGFLSFNHQGISHLTGVTSMLGSAIARGSIAETVHFLLAIAAFVAGCIISGAITKDSTLKIQRSYAWALFLVSALLLISIPLFESGDMFAIYLASMACGIQNAMITTYSGAALRTTHISGMFTDLGISIGHWIRGVPSNPRRLKLCTVVITGFLFGGITSAFGFDRIGYTILLLPSLLTAVLGLITLVMYPRS